MNEVYTTELLGLGVSLTELAVKGTATAISSKIKAIKDEKNIDNVRTTYDEIINELLSEREEAVRIAQAYKSELEKVVKIQEMCGFTKQQARTVIDKMRNEALIILVGKGPAAGYVRNRESSDN